MKRWQPGEVVVGRYAGLGHTFFAAPMTVVHDGDDYFAVLADRNSPNLQVVPADGSALPRVVPPSYFEENAVAYRGRQLSGRASLLITPTGTEHAVHVRLPDDSLKPRGFYVNLQSSLRRDEYGFSVVDHFLDIVVGPDLSWDWKDEDELIEAVRVGRLTQTDADMVRAEGERVVEDIEHRRWPFDGSFDDWRPDPAWPIPVFPPGWEIEE